MQLNLRKFISRRFDKWLSGRLRKVQSQQLSDRNIYIFPSKFGLTYIAFIFLLFLLGTNYQNNLILLFCFLQASFFISSMLHTFFNLSGLHISAESEYQVFKGKESVVKLNVNSKRPLFAVNFAFGNCGNIRTDIQRSNKFVELDYVANKRGVYDIERLKISSRYAFDLFNCWSYTQFFSRVVVYPEPVAINQVEFDHVLSLARQNQEDIAVGHTPNMAKVHGEDFSELRRYQLGEPISQVAWKNVAKGQPWMTKHYESDVSDRIVLSLDHFHADDVETRLGKLCYVLLNLQTNQAEYGLNLQNINVLPDNSPEHFERCLRMLAEYE